MKPSTLTLSKALLIGLATSFFTVPSLITLTTAKGPSVSVNAVPTKTSKSTKKSKSKSKKKSDSVAKSDDTEDTSNPGVVEILSGLQNLQSGLLTLFAKVATHIDEQAEVEFADAKKQGYKLDSNSSTLNDTVTSDSESDANDLNDTLSNDTIESDLNSTSNSSNVTESNDTLVNVSDESNDIPKNETAESIRKKAEEGLRNHSKEADVFFKNPPWASDSDSEESSDDLDDLDSFDPPQPSTGPQIREFAKNWLSLFGWSTGITGLAKDFVFNYFKRDFFHDRNGPLINSIKALVGVLSKRSSDIELVKAVDTLVRRGKAIFTKDGALKSIFIDLEEIMKDKRFFDAINSDSVGKSDLDAVKMTLKFLITDIKHQKPGISEKELDQMDYEEL